MLDGTLDEIQSNLRLRHDSPCRPTTGMDALDGLAGIDEITDQGNLQEVTMVAVIPSDLLEHARDRTRITHFEVARPSLHDIFVRIASPEPVRGARDLHR